MADQEGLAMLIVFEQGILIDAELQQIVSAPRPAVTFTRLWTMKEAAFKLIGTGIGNDMKGVLSSDFCFTTVEYPKLNYVYSVCTRK